MYAFVLILGLNPGAVPRMGLRPVAPAPFGSCLCFVIYLFEVPNKALKKTNKQSTGFSSKIDLVISIRD